MQENNKINIWLNQLSNGSFHAFERLYQHYSGKLYNFVMRLSQGNQYMSEEIVQQAFIKVWEVRATIDPDGNFISYLCTTARNILLNNYQRETVEFVYKEYLMNHQSDREHTTDEHIDIRFLNEYIDILAQDLPEARKKIFLLSKREHYSNKEIAEMLGVNESTVSTQLSLAVKYMREQFMKHYDKLVALTVMYIVNKF